MRHLTIEQRYTISVLKKEDYKNKDIALIIGVSPSTISRELKRNALKRGGYNPDKAQEFYEIRKERFAKNRKFTSDVEKIVRFYLEEEQWSPDVIKHYCDINKIAMVSVERIYQFIREDKRNGGGLYKHLRHQLKHRKRVVGASKSKIPNRVSINERPEKINNREEFGHWEADLISGKNHQGFIVTLTERVSKQILMDYLPKGKDSEGVAQAIINLCLPYKNSVKSITMDNGMEFSKHEKVAKKLEAKTYFTNPYSSWEKGQIEYMNKLIRQYYPKNEVINKHNTKNIREIQVKLNRRPRKGLGYKMPFKIFAKFVV